MATIGSSEWLIYMHRGEVKVKEGRKEGWVFRPKGSRIWLTTCPPKPNILYKGAMRVEKEEDIQRAKTLVWENYAFNHFDPRKINNKCKECKYLKVTWHNEDYTRGSGECMEIHRRNWENIRGRVFSNQACMHFEKKEKENNMTVKDVSNYIYDCEDSLRNVDKTLDMLEKELSNTPDVDDPRAPKNKYGIGETLYLPVTIAGIRESVNGSTILYEVKTAFGKRLGFKVFECASDIWRDKDHYMVSIPENLLVENFEEA